MELHAIEFGSLLSYSPRGESELEKSSKTAMRSLKGDLYILNPPILMSDYISNLVKKRFSTLPFSNFFTSGPILVPIPKSSLMRPETLWVPQRLANALIQNEFGKAMNECLKRVTPLRKSATSFAWDRPKAAEHYDSFEAYAVSPEPKEILLVDDVVTRGATFIGAANKLKVVFPSVISIIFLPRKKGNDCS